MCGHACVPLCACTRAPAHTHTHNHVHVFVRLCELHVHMCLVCVGCTHVSRLCKCAYIATCVHMCACVWCAHMGLCVCSVSSPPPSLPGPKLVVSGSSSLGERCVEMPTSEKICLLGPLASPGRDGQWNRVQITALSREGCAVCACSIHCPTQQRPGLGPRVDT